jgi:pimeloyl-ACP methyl ester carboxylesterase
MLGLPEKIAAATAKELGKVERDGYVIGKLAFEAEPGMTVPALVFLPKDATESLILYVHDQGKAADAGPGGPIEKLVRAGHRVVAVDLRGWGETSPGKPPANKPDFWGPDWKEAFLGQHLNRPLLGQRVLDLLAVIEKLDAFKDVQMIGIGAAGPVVLHAAALEPRIKSVTLEKPVVSWSAVVRTPVGHGQLANVVPGALKAYDLPDLAKLVAPRPLTIRAAVDPVMKPVAQAVLNEAYAGTKKAYAAAKAEKSLVLKAAE